ncbi:MAG: hypothetical protein IPK50_14520 [Fibrobacterota bacterium]|nr:hypothetical protein [Fibrobacterota bacterium]QQS03511.1 MAG: hypothetical protein IPK50_14520 [Fibrobacterota bacterium]
MANSSPSPLTGAFVSLCVFLGSGAFGGWFGTQMAPESTVATLVGLLMLPIAFMVGMQVWLGAAMIAWLFGWLFPKKTRPRSAPPGEGAGATRETRSGALVFAVVFPLFTIPAGMLTGWLSNEHSFLTVLALYTGLGMVFGAMVWQLAKHGYIEILEEA